MLFKLYQFTIKKWIASSLALLAMTPVFVIASEAKQSRASQTKREAALFFFGLGSYFLLSYPVLAEELILSCPHRQIPFKIELAKTAEECAKGLMGRHTLGEDEGMLFLFPETHPVTMWMKDTPLSLDMIFANKEGKIIAIEENTTPYSLKLIGPIENTVQVLELNAGIVKKHDISKDCFLSLNN